MDTANFQKLNGLPADIMEVKRRREHVKNIIVNHPSYNETLETLEEVHLFSTDSVESDSLFLYGTPGVGKSTVLEKYRDKYVNN